MIIPIRCFTCGKVLANKWLAYNEEVKKLREGKGADDEVHDLAPNFDKSHTGKVLDKLEITRICCRRHMLSHVEIIDNI